MHEVKNEAGTSLNHGHKFAFLSLECNIEIIITFLLVLCYTFSLPSSLPPGMSENNENFP